MDEKTKELNKKIGNRLKYERKRKGITQERFAELSNYSIQHISYIENGSRKMTFDAAASFSNILGVTIDYLMCKTDFKQNGEYSCYDLKRIIHTYSSILNILFEYNYDFIGIYLPLLKKATYVPQKWTDKEKIECLSKICVNNEAAGTFYIELLEEQIDTDNFLFIFQTPEQKRLEISPFELSKCIENIVQYSQLQFLNLEPHTHFDLLRRIKKAANVFTSDNEVI